MYETSPDAATPFTPQGDWYAVQTTDQAAVLDAFGLDHPRRVALNDALRPWDIAYSDELLDASGVLVTPALDGWTLVFGYPDTENFHADRQRWCTALSRSFGATHWYSLVENGGCGDSDGWCLAERGALRRYVCRGGYGADVLVGGAHPAETGLLLDDVGDWLTANGFPDDLWTNYQYEGYRAGLPVETRWQRLQQHTGIPDLADSLTIAARTSLSPARLSAATRVSGHAVLATPPRTLVPD
ncbi:hypothetical protein ACFVMC_08355 [Nocardia sp. NPDC127579]|uniref:hypothetical protein n=1 Tax=Nocardia sp. NPDC127579 TaxID=3345402 RepID=UPI00362F216B